jgi:asparagine synthetase B (glutamine-hydrolysing)
VTEDRVGDLALTFVPNPPPRSRAQAPWTLAAHEGGGWLWSTAGTAGWRGLPATWDRGDHGVRVTLGRRPEHWLAFAWDRGDGTWTVRTDRFATIHAYAGADRVATYSPAVWDVDPALDWLAIAGFARLGWYPGDRLPVTGARLLRPATNERWDAAGTWLGGRRWSHWHHEPRALTEEAATGELAGVLEEILDEEVAGARAGLPISGGLDSRVTVAALTRPGAPEHDLWAYGYGYDATSPELRIAGQVAAARDLALERRVIAPYLFDDLDEVADATEGLVDLTLCRQSAMAEDLRAHTDVVVAAHWGDVWFGLPAAPPDGDPATALLAASTKRGHEWLTTHLVEPHLGRDPEPELRALLADEAAAVAEVEDPRVRQLALKTEQWSLRWTQATLRAYEAATTPRLPFYDPRLADLALSLPAELLADRRLQIALLRRHAPDLARIEWQAVETDLFRLRHERTWRLPHRALRRIRRRLRPPTARLRNWETQLLEPAGRAGVDRWLVEPGAGIHDLVDASAVQGLVGAHRAAPTDPGLGYAVSALLTFAVWKERFT